jgi:hypothetical protein
MKVGPSSGFFEKNGSHNLEISDIFSNNEQTALRSIFSANNSWKKLPKTGVHIYYPGKLTGMNRHFQEMPRFFE